MTNATAPNPANSASAPTPPAKERDYGMVNASVPLDLQTQIEETAKNQKVSVTTLVRRFIASAMHYDVSNFERTRKRGRVKYGTEAERIAAVAEANAERAATVRALMAKFKKGEITLGDEEIAAAKTEVKPRKAKATAATK